MAFDPKLLAPAVPVTASAARTMKQVALSNIDKQVALLADPAIEGKRTFTVEGDRAQLQVRISNQPLELEVFVDGKPALAKQVSVPAKSLKDAFLYYRKAIEDGKYDAALDQLTDKRTARTDKMRTTRAAKKDAPAAKS